MSILEKIQELKQSGCTTDFPNLLTHELIVLDANIYGYSLFQCSKCDVRIFLNSVSEKELKLLNKILKVSCDERIIRCIIE